MYRSIIWIPLLIILTFAPADLSAREEFARREGLKCSACHCDSYGKTPLNRFGERYRTWSGLIPDDGSRFWLRGAQSPALTEAQIRVLYRKYLKQGKRLFRYDRLGLKRVSCSSCHDLNPVGRASGKTPPLGKVFERYPRYRPEARAFVTVGQAINLCIERHMKGKAFRLGSPALVALEQFLKRRSVRQP